MLKKSLLLTFFVSQIVLLKAESYHALKEDLFQKIVERNEALNQLGRQVTSDPFEESVIADKKNGESVAERIKIFVTQQNNDLSPEKQPQYLLESEEKIQDLKKRLVAEQGSSNRSAFLLHIFSGTCTVISLIKAIHEYKNNENCFASLIMSGLCGCITIGLRFLIDDLQPGIDSCTNSTYAIETLKIEIQQQQKPGQAAPTDEKVK